jgi:hypothetical protein
LGICRPNPLSIRKTDRAKNYGGTVLNLIADVRIRGARHIKSRRRIRAEGGLASH